MSEKVSGLPLLREPFPAHQISKLPKGNVMLDYVGHAALTDRLLDADPSWNWEPMALTPVGLPLFDETGGLWIRLTVCGMTRLGYGHAPKKSDPGAREKEVIGDALRNAAMRFGAALDLWHKGQLHIEETPDGTVREDAVTPPSGFAEAYAELVSSSRKGEEALKAQWKGRTPMMIREFITKERAGEWDQLKADAKAVTA